MPALTFFESSINEGRPFFVKDWSLRSFLIIFRYASKIKMIIFWRINWHIVFISLCLLSVLLPLISFSTSCFLSISFVTLPLARSMFRILTVNVSNCERNRDSSSLYDFAHTCITFHNYLNLKFLSGYCDISANYCKNLHSINLTALIFPAH